MMFNKELVKILACPDCGGKVAIKKSKLKNIAELICLKCRRVFTFKDGVIGMLPKTE